MLAFHVPYRHELFLIFLKSSICARRQQRLTNFPVTSFHFSCDVSFQSYNIKCRDYSVNPSVTDFRPKPGTQASQRPHMFNWYLSYVCKGLDVIQMFSIYKTKEMKTTLYGQPHIYVYFYFGLCFVLISCTVELKIINECKDRYDADCTTTV